MGLFLALDLYVNDDWGKVRIVAKCGQGVGGALATALSLSIAVHGLSTRSVRPYRTDIHMEGRVSKVLVSKRV
jgi:hypothetical protein